MTSLTEIMNRLPAARRKRIEERAATIIAEEWAKLGGVKSDEDRPPSIM